jgi:hypothetical protein
MKEEKTMSLKPEIIEVTSKNLAEYPQVICYINPKNPFYHHKVDWLNGQFKKGLRIKLLFIEEVKRPFGFIETIPGEHCWRAVSAKGYLFIHCLWTNGKKFQKQGLGRLLIQDAERHAKGMRGVAVLTSDKAFMTNKDIFIKNGYKVVSESGSEQLLVKQFKKGPMPSINNWEKELAKYKGLAILYSKQCPWVARFMDEVKPILKKEKLEPKIIELKTAAQAQKAPSVYSAFNLIYNGKLLSDRYISTTRFKNIVKKELKS